MKALFFSDAHLLGNDARRAERVDDFVRETSRDADLIFVLGDLFEFYHGFDNYLYPFYRQTIDVLKELARKKRVYFLEGNHEFGMGPFFQSYTGVSCHRSLEVQLDEKWVYLAHGDHFSNGRLGRFLRSRFTYRIMDALGPTFTWSVAMGCRPFLSKSVKPYNEQILNKYRVYGKRKLDEGYDAVILGHSHMADLLEYEYDGKKKTYMNTGDLTGLFTYGIYNTGEGFRLNKYERRI